MFKERSTLIVGAGTSIDFGLPSGPELWFEVKKCVRDVHSAIKPKPPANGPVLVSAAPRLVLESPAVQAMLRLLNREAKAARISVGALVEQLSDGDVHASVDEFIRDNPSIADEVKVAIASVLFDRLYDRDGRFWLRSERLLANQLSQRSGSLVPNWCRQFVGVCRPFLRMTQTPAKMTIINFNYDRVMETVLRHFWEISEAEYHPFEECFEFIYPYGAFDSLPEELRSPEEWICDQAQNIGLAGGDDRSWSPLLKNSLDASLTIFSLGFSFARANTELLGYNALHAARTFYQNYKGSDLRLDRVLASYYINPNHRDQGSMTELIASGFFEQVGAWYVSK